MDNVFHRISKCIPFHVEVLAGLLGFWAKRLFCPPAVVVSFGCCAAGLLFRFGDVVGLVCWVLSLVWCRLLTRLCDFLLMFNFTVLGAPWFFRYGGYFGDLVPSQASVYSSKLSSMHHIHEVVRLG
ncbi:hypothetical protein L2E82_31280 [Cichorium intybus]|uniref:Uncharacterized protein n=1 Tax=Cichorium intybus TaxID=13427 RepID=A0ACB9D2S6_CICIN|nr:hypothetical protein L2E82_31280 [Cichorium intybus]